MLVTDTGNEIYKRHKVPGTWGFIRNDVKVYRVTYRTRNTDGKEIVVSGAILVPKGKEQARTLRTLCYCRGTIIPGSDELNAPSYYKRESIKDAYADHYEMSFIAATFAAAGYLVVAPDFIGYGASKGCEHPYLHAESLASTALDALRAAREFAAEQSLCLDNRILVTGWSEGGLAGMALHKLIEESNGNEYSVAASSLLAGTYALSAQIHLFCSYEEDYPEANINYWKLRTLCRVYKHQHPFEMVVRAPFAEMLSRDVMALVPKNPQLALDPTFRSSFLAGLETEMEASLRKNDRYDWKPQASVFLHHGTHDEIVPFSCAQMAYESMRAKGCKVHLIPYLGQDHYGPANSYVVRTLQAFEKL
jgi:dienelactone hydrolase